MRRVWLALVFGGWLGALAPSHSAAQTPSASASADAAALPEGPKLPADADLPALLPLPQIQAEPVDPVAAKDLGHLLAKLTSAKADIRDAARKDVNDVAPTSVGAIAVRIEEVRGRLDRDRAPRLLADVRKAAKAGKKSKKDDLPDDWLLFLHESPKVDDETWRDLVELTGMVRMLGAIGTTPAVREMVALRGKFGDLLRIDLQRQIEVLKDKAVAGLIEAKRNDVRVVARFAELELDKLGRAIPGEAVAASDPDILADVLRAFGYVRDVDAVGVCLSFANHDRRKIREAARQAIAGIGEAGRWQLRDTLQDLTGEKADKSVAWDILARRIFYLYDQARVAELLGIADAGLAAQSANRFEEAVLAFDKVLARDPLYERRSEMIPAYVKVALAMDQTKSEERLALLRKARRLGADEKTASSIDADIAVTEAKILIQEGRPERFLLVQALEHNPDHAEAKELLASFEQKAVAEQPKWPKHLVMGGIGLGALSLAGLILAVGRGRKKKPMDPEKNPKDLQPPSEPAKPSPEDDPGDP